MKTSSFTTLLIRVAVIFVFMIVALVFWGRWVPYDRQWRKPAHLIESFLSAAQKKDYTQTRSLFSSHQLTNIAAWEGSFEVWCDQFAGYSKFEVGPTGPGKAGHYWTEVFGVTPDGRREFVERIYAKRFDGVWSLEYGLNYEAWLELHQSDASAQQTNAAELGR
jgi:hypothetical protein